MSDVPLVARSIPTRYLLRMSNVLPLARKEARRAELGRLCAAYDGEIVRDARAGQRVQVRGWPQHAQAHNGTDALLALKPTKRPRNKGMPEFEPDGQQKRFVAAMAGMRMSWDEIRLVVINPRTGRPISKETLQRAFAQELEVGKAKLKALIIAKYHAKLDDGDWNAINFGLKHVCGFRDDPLATQIGATALHDSDKPKTSVLVEFVVPTRSKE